MRRDLYRNRDEFVNPNPVSEILIRDYTSLIVLSCLPPDLNQKWIIKLIYPLYSRYLFNNVKLRHMYLRILDLFEFPSKSWNRVDCKIRSTKKQHPPDKIRNVLHIVVGTGGYDLLSPCEGVVDTVGLYRGLLRFTGETPF